MLGFIFNARSQVPRTGFTNRSAIVALNIPIQLTSQRYLFACKFWIKDRDSGGWRVNYNHGQLVSAFTHHHCHKKRNGHSDPPLENNRATNLIERQIGPPSYLAGFIPSISEYSRHHLTNRSLRVETQIPPHNAEIEP